MMKLFSTLILSLGALIISGCTSAQTSLVPADNSSRSLSEITYHVAAASEYPANADYGEAAQSVHIYHSDDANESAEFEARYEKLTGEKAPEVTGGMIIAQMGAKRSGGYGIEVASITDEARAVKVKLHLISPKEGDLVTMALTNPYIVIVLPDVTKEIEVVVE